ncbi:prolyl oligopeptidase family serine peptidase [Archangium minus]|uniref:carboxylesterase family protein n=1 Tax=Archangium minus TaxID=83450 RepID=UPI0037BF424F
MPICGGLDAPGRRTLPRNPGAASSVPEPFLEAARHLRHVPTWIFHGEEDTIIPVEESRIMVQALREVGAPVRYTVYPEVEHDSWDPAYAEQELMPSYAEQELMPWLLSHVRAP